MIRTFVLLFGTCLIAGAAAAESTTVRTGPNGTSTTVRTTDGGTYTATERWVGNDGGIYDRTTTCIAGTCTTDWVLVDRASSTSSATRETTWGDGRSTTTVDGTGPRGRDFGRTIERSRTVTHDR